MYLLDTNVIYAGGHNIQRLHYRYLTKTLLPKSSKTEETKKVEELIKSIKRKDALIEDIKSLELNIVRIKCNLLIAESYSDTEIIANQDKRWHENQVLTWTTIVERGADRNYDYDEVKFLCRKQEMVESAINLFKSIKIESPKRALLSKQKELAKLNRKLSVLIEKEKENQ